MILGVLSILALPNPGMNVHARGVDAVEVGYEEIEPFSVICTVVAGPALLFRTAGCANGTAIGQVPKGTVVEVLAGPEQN